MVLLWFWGLLQNWAFVSPFKPVQMSVLRGGWCTSGKQVKQRFGSQMHGFAKVLITFAKLGFCRPPIQYSAFLNRALQCFTVHNSTWQYCTVPYCTVLYFTVLYFTKVLQPTVPCSTLQYLTVLYNTCYCLTVPSCPGPYRTLSYFTVPCLIVLWLILNYSTWLP